jgi:hypothetical protein
MRPNGPGKVETAGGLGSYGAHAAAAGSIHYPLALVGLACEALFPCTLASWAVRLWVLWEGGLLPS